MTTYALPSDWDILTRECYSAHGCSDLVVGTAQRRKDRRAEKEARKKQAEIDRVAAAYKQALAVDPNAPPEELKAQVIEILIPWLLQWMLSVFTKMLIDWFMKKLNPET